MGAPGPSPRPEKSAKNAVIHQGMNVNTTMLATAAALSDDDLLARLAALAGKERETLVELLAHLAALDSRPSVYAGQGYGSLFSYCTQALRLSEDAACSRIEAARACQRFPVILTGDPAAIFDRALTLLLEHVEKKKLGLTMKPRSGTSIRPGTDGEIRTPVVRSRHVPMAVKRAVWQRDGGRCAFVPSDGPRCTEREFLEFHHVQAYAKAGPATIETIRLRCRRHNQYEAEVIFGHHGNPNMQREASGPGDCASRGPTKSIDTGPRGSGGTAVPPARYSR